MKTLRCWLKGIGTAVLAALVSASVAPPASAQGTGPAFDRVKRLGRGVNVFGYDPIWKSFTKARFQEAHFRPILLGEFGAYEKAPMESRVRYIAAVARAAEARGWAWAYWQFDSDFIVYDVDRGRWVEPIFRALIPK